MRYANTGREPARNDVVLVKGHMGEWLVEEIDYRNELLGLRGMPWAFIWDRASRVKFLRLGTEEDIQRHMPAMEKIRKGTL